jgi:glycine betaine/proline transport system substrate-binding protein
VPFTSFPDGATGNTEFNGQNLGFAVHKIGIVARNDFLAVNPAAAKLFEVAKLSINDIPAENKLIADGENTSEATDKHTDDWIAAHQAEYDSWLAAAE